MRDTIRIGIIGPGNIANAFADAAVQSKKVTLAAAASRDLAKARAFCEKYKIPQAYGDYDALLADDTVDAVYIAVPHNFHAELAKKALLKGKAVLCEKPFTTTEAQAREVIDLAREKKLLFMECLWTRFLPTTRKAHQWIEEGKIGALKLIDASFCFYSDVNESSRLFNPALAGGALYDVGVYGIQFAMDFAGAEPVKISGACSRGITGVDEVSAITMRFANSVLASITAGTRVATVQNGYLYGTEGYIQLPTFWGSTEAYLYNREGVLLDQFESDYKGKSRYQGFLYYIDHYADLFLSGKTESPIEPPSATLTCARLFEEFLASCE